MLRLSGAAEGTPPPALIWCGWGNLLRSGEGREALPSTIAQAYSENVWAGWPLGPYYRYPCVSFQRTAGLFFKNLEVDFVEEETKEAHALPLLRGPLGCTGLRMAFTMKQGEYDAVCAPAIRSATPMLRVQPGTAIPLGTFWPMATCVPADGKTHQYCDKLYQRADDQTGGIPLAGKLSAGAPVPGTYRLSGGVHLQAGYSSLQGDAGEGAKASMELTAEQQRKAGRRRIWA